MSETKLKLLQYRALIEKYFLIDLADTGQLVPFRFNQAQEKYFALLLEDYDQDVVPIREIILKARREGFTSFLLALFAAECILSETGVRSVEISYKDDATRQHFRRFCTYIESFCVKKGVTLKQFCRISENNEVMFPHNRSSFYVGTASARTGERGGTVQNILFSEAAHYPDTENMKAAEIIDAASRMVDISAGKIFIETTANGFGNHFELMWQQAVRNNIRHKPRFFGWREFYTEEQFKIISSEHPDKNMLKQEYPETPMEAFISSGRPVFDNDTLAYRYNEIPTEKPPIVGNLLKKEDGKLLFDRNSSGFLQIWKPPIRGHSYVIGADVAESGDYSSADVIDRLTLEQVAHWHGHIDEDRFGALLCLLGQLYEYIPGKPAWIGAERNGLGIATLLAMKRLKYPAIYYQDVLDQRTKKKTRKYGWTTSTVTKPLMIADLARVIRDRELTINSLQTVDELMAYSYDERGRMNSPTGHDDRVISLALAVQMHILLPIPAHKADAAPAGSFLKAMERHKRAKGRGRRSLFS